MSRGKDQPVRASVRLLRTNGGASAQQLIPETDVWQSIDALRMPALLALITTFS